MDGELGSFFFLISNPFELIARLQCHDATLLLACASFKSLPPPFFFRTT